jgi:hypothetical protein
MKGKIEQEKKGKSLRRIWSIIHSEEMGLELPLENRM